jgi:hypothetical protein
MQIRVFDVNIQEKVKLYAPNVIGPNNTYQFIKILGQSPKGLLQFRITLDF